MTDAKRVVLLAGAGEPTNITYHSLATLMGPIRVVVEAPERRTRFLKRRIKKLGFGTVVGQVLFSGLVLPLLRRSSRTRRQEILRMFSMDISPIPSDQILHVPSANLESSIRVLKELNPEIVVLCGTRIISRAVLEAVPAFFLNIHAGITPLYRGVHGGYWALVERRPEACGVTVHRVDAGIDTGEILAQAAIEPGPRDCFCTYPLLQLGVGLQLLRTVLKRLSSGESWSLAPPSGKSALWSHPTMFEYMRHRVVSGVR